MTNKTVLSMNKVVEISNQAERIYSRTERIRFIEQAVLQSPEIQQLRKDADQYINPLPMDAAPKNGTEILGVFKDGNVMMMVWEDKAGDNKYTGWSPYCNWSGGVLYELVNELNEEENDKLIGWLPVPRPQLNAAMEVKP